MQEDVRGTMREHTFLPAKIFFNDKQSVFDCVVKNISESGAQLRVASRLGIPKSFTLFIPALEKRYPCWIAWSNMSDIGVTFSQPSSSEGKPDLRLVDK